MDWPYRSFPKEWDGIADLMKWLENSYPDTAKMPNLAILIAQCKWANMVAALKKLFDDDNAFGSHLEVFVELCSMLAKMALPLPDSDTIITAVAFIDENTGLTSKHSNVSGVKKGSDDTFYALEMSPWSDWLSYKVIPENVACFESVEDYVASIIWEMTFLGFSNDNIQAYAARLQAGAQAFFGNIDAINEAFEKQENS